MKKIFSGVQPTNVIHIGNYLGALKQWVALQNDQQNECIFCVVDLHAITVPQDPKVLREKILETAALFIACGIDPEKSTLFIQSSRLEHTELAWILNCFTQMGELSRMTQFKEKSGKHHNNVSVGLYDYPILMVADILLYQTTHVPVGDDQKQHLELTRDLAERMNKKYEELFTIPEPIINKSTARIMALDDPTKKMSKSSVNTSSYISLLDDAETIKAKVKRATTDSGNEIKSDSQKPAINNLLGIYSGITDQSVNDIEKRFVGKSYAEFKEALAEEIIKELKPIQEKYHQIMADKNQLVKILDSGSQKVAKEAKQTLEKVKKAIGIL